FFYFNSKYRVLPKSTPADPYMSSTLLLIRTARWLSIRSGQHEFFDIRILAVLRMLIFLFGFWLVLVSARSLKLGLRAILAGLLILNFTNVRFIAYFNMLYYE